MDTLIQDVVFGFRQLLHHRGSSLVAVLTLALGIGVASALFSVIDAALLRPLPYPHPEQLVKVSAEETLPDGRSMRPSPSMEDMRAWQRADDVFSAVAGWGTVFGGVIVDGPQPERIEVLRFTEDYLSMRGIAPLLGRGFNRKDCDPGSPLVAVLGYGYWRSHYGGRDVLGQTIRLDDDLATIVGVLPASFNDDIPVSVPLQVPAKEFSRRGTGRVIVYARLRAGVTIDQAQARLSAGMLDVPHDTGARHVRAIVTSRLEDETSGYGTTVGVFVGAVGLILLIACVNVAGLLLARGASRQVELGVRASLGAGRRRLVRQLLTESVVLALPGCALGLVLAWLSLDVIVANIPMRLPSNAPAAVNLRVVAATAALLFPVTLLFGLAPAIRLSGVRFGAALSRGGRQGGSSLSRRGGQALIAAEIALAVVLVAGAGLMIRSFLRLSAVDLGFNPDGLLTMQVLPLEHSPAAQTAYYVQLLRRVRSIRGLSSAGLVDNFPLGGMTSYSQVETGGRSYSSTIFEAMPGYFETIGATLRSGRFPSDAEYASGFPGVVINESAANMLFPGSDAVGRNITRPKSDSRWTVLGVIADLRHGGPLRRRSQHEPQVFFPFETDEHDLTRAMTIVMRTTDETAGLADQLRDAAASIGPRALVERISTAQDLFGDRVVTPRRRTVLLGLLGGLGLALALVGVFGMTAYAVARRTMEIGLRLALGARPGQVVGRMVRDSAVPIAFGAVVGLGAAALSTRLIRSFLFQTAPTDPLTLITVAAVLVTAGFLAAVVPALRAANVDPASCLRAE